jgi:uncharacterized protein
MSYREKILKLTKKYYKKLDGEDFSHNFDHFLRVEKLAKRIGKEENADLEVIEASCLLFDIARILEDEGKAKDHAEEGAKIAREILEKINFPNEKIDNVCHSILVHRKSKNRIPETIEAKILQDSDYLDAMGAIDIARVILSSFVSKKYKRPVYVDEPYTGNENLSAIHYMIHKINHPKLQPENFNTKLGKDLAKERFKFSKNFVERFIKEWKGEK